MIVNSLNSTRSLKLNLKMKLETTKNKTQTTKKKKVRFEWPDSQAKEVYLAGSFNDWNPTKTPLKLAGNSAFQKTLTLAPGRYEYLFVVDGQWQADPSGAPSVPNPFGGINNLVEVSAK